MPRALHCHRGRCRRKGAKLFEVTVPIVINDDVQHNWLGTVSQVFGGGSVHALVQVCARHEDRLRRFTRWVLRPR
jgi:hypothetical protein